MSKAEERALEKYPLMADDDKEGLEALKYIGMECECASVFNEVQEAQQTCFIEGYHQAEKDLELTWEDIASINDIVTNMLNDCSDNILYDTEMKFCQEVLKRFKAQKGEEV